MSTDYRQKQFEYKYLMSCESEYVILMILNISYKEVGTFHPKPREWVLCSRNTRRVP